MTATLPAHPEAGDPEPFRESEPDKPADERRPYAEFGELLSRHQAGLNGYAKWLTKDRELAADLAAEAWLRVWVRMVEGKEIAHPGRYLRQIVHNLFIDHLHRPVWTVSLDALAEKGTRMPTVPTAADNVGDEVVERDAFLRAVRILSKRDRAILWCASTTGGPAEVAAAAGLPSRNAAAVATHRARRALLSALLPSH